MMTQTVSLAAALALVFAALVVGVVVAYLVAAGRRAALQAEVRQARDRATELVGERDAERRRADALALDVTELRSKQAADGERIAWLQNAEKTLRETFESLASRTLRASTQALSEQSRAQLDQFANVLKHDWGKQKAEISTVVQPIGEELRKLDHHVRALEQKREGAYQSLNEQIRQVADQYTKLQTATNSLDQALRNSSVRGKWGEVQLRRLVEISGMSEHVDFEEQLTAPAGTDGQRGRPDLIVHLPSNGILAVDAKAPMAAYLESVEAPSPDLSRVALKRHASALRGHIQALAQKAYWSQFERAPEFVVLLVPYESGLSAAFATDPDLLEYALANRVIVAAPASFLALLRVVAYGWMQLQLSENAQAISAAGKELLDRLSPFAEHLNKVAQSLNRSVDSMNAAAGSFERRILPTARRLHELGAASEAPPELPTIDTRAREVATPEKS